jgi:hypothetical protein
MARTIRTKVFKFNELNKDAKKKVVDKYRYINVDDDYWHKWQIEEEIEELKKAGYDNPKIYFSGFASQGDGAYFICDNIDFRVFRNGKYKDYSRSFMASISHNWRYYYASSTTVNLEQCEDIDAELYDEIEEDIEEEREKLGNEIYRRLEETYFSLMEDEAVIDTIEANEYEFTKDGNRFIPSFN